MPATDTPKRRIVRNRPIVELCTANHEHHRLTRVEFDRDRDEVTGLNKRGYMETIRLSSVIHQHLIRDNEGDYLRKRLCFAPGGRR